MIVSGKSQLASVIARIVQGRGLADFRLPNSSRNSTLTGHRQNRSHSPSIVPNSLAATYSPIRRAWHTAVLLKQTSPILVQGRKRHFIFLGSNTTNPVTRGRVTASAKQSGMFCAHAGWTCRSRCTAWRESGNLQDLHAMRGAANLSAILR